PRVPAHWSGFETTLRLGGKAFTLRHGTPPADATSQAPPREPTHHAALGEWIDWRALPDGAVVQVAA
ncbi:MAG TPA: hypothetical protein VLK60_13265, partial [Variovorax sp.]|nr:hypothetical protein [Variovorax sp.]